MIFFRQTLYILIFDFKLFPFQVPFPLNLKQIFGQLIRSLRISGTGYEKSWDLGTSGIPQGPACHLRCCKKIK